MFTNQNTNRILIFLAFAFVIPWAAALAISLSGLMANNPAQSVTLANYIFISTPWLANILTRLVTREGWRNLRLRPNFKRGWRFYLAVWLLPLLATIVGMVIFFIIYPQSFDPQLNVVRKLVENSPAAMVTNPWLTLLSIMCSMMFISVPINTLASIGEEFGWRAYLLPKLIIRFAGAGSDENELTSLSLLNPALSDSQNTKVARKAALLTGVIHGIWHWPLLILSAKLVPGITFLTLLVYIVFTCSLSILLSWALLRSGSVWAASLGHASVNATSALPGFMLNGQAVPLIGPDATGLIGGIGYTIVALVLFTSRTAFALKKEPSFKQGGPYPTSE